MTESHVKWSNRNVDDDEKTTLIGNSNGDDSTTINGSTDTDGENDESEDEGPERPFDPAESLHRKFFDAVRACNVMAVQNLFDKLQTDDRTAITTADLINYKNYRGMTALNMAIEADCEPMVDLLLSKPGLIIGDSLLYAIRQDRYTVVVKLLEAFRATVPDLAYEGYDKSTVFPAYLTPLVLAAQCGRYKIIDLLLKQGHIIEIPHEPTCVCKEVCKSMAQLNNGLGAADQKLSVFRAISNPAYIALTSKDPVLEAFRLSRLLRRHGNVDRIFKSDYESLDLQTRKFAVNLVGMCRSSTETQLLLSNREGCTFFGAFPYHRLVLAVDTKQKEFVAHAYVQQTLEASWSGDWYEWKRMGLVRKAVVALGRIPMLIPVVLIHLLAPYSRYGRWYSLPVNRLLNYMASYAIFLALLTYENNASKMKPRVESAVVGGGESKARNLETASCEIFDDGVESGFFDSGLFDGFKGSNRIFFEGVAGGGNPFHGHRLWVKAALVIYVIAFLVRALRLICVQSPKRYFRVLWNVYDCTMYSIFALTFSCWAVTYGFPQGYAIAVATASRGVVDGNSAAVDPHDRRYWYWYHPVLLAEGLLAIATVMSYLRLLFLCQLSYALGPMQVSLGRMTTDFARFAILFGIIILAFTAGLCRLYQYYDGMTRKDPNGDRDIEQDTSFVSIYATLKTLFWGIFCMTPPTAGSVVIEYNPEKDGGVSDAWQSEEGSGSFAAAINQHYATQAVGTLLYAIFETLTVIVMLNMLIATMTNTFQRVTGNSYVEWVFGRTQVFLSFSVHTDLPPPFNLLPTLDCLWDYAKCMCECCKASAKAVVKAFTDDYPNLPDREYEKLMSALVRRYFRSKLAESVIRKCGPKCG
ncbi:short transient receptor potential channel 3-like [Daktulosphaira vitifoliae]|uniref:short transient receptor potential channel 3-like n=1 Tax=Daktulosphaira vitifoliae TaxID=58002 RepID=UPI0021A9FD66|nr:short transient receptor potential channel 3-like [Daktulosphaira vitifoliae]